MLKIRLTRLGTKQKPFYRVVVIDERSKRSGAYIELLGSYNPLTEPKDIKLKQDRVDYWIKQGAQMSDGFLRMIGKAKQRPPRKPKKEKKVEQPPAANQQPAEEQTPAEASKEEKATKENTDERPA
ncbi:30S ribosomal protein S16 [Candidatus Daviesbacteria bacterium]|nr:30S ribosomal protein S16 [Candidatus Daviesbacteria bacterium]